MSFSSEVNAAAGRIVRSRLVDVLQRANGTEFGLELKSSAAGSLVYKLKALQSELGSEFASLSVRRSPVQPDLVWLVNGRTNVQQTEQSDD